MSATSEQPLTGSDAFSLFSGEFAENAAPLFAQLRMMGPLFPLPGMILGTDRQGWVVTRMDEAVQILKDATHFTVDPRSIGGGNPFGNYFGESGEASDTPAFFTPGGSMLMVDDPDHRRLRALVSKAFTPKYIESLRPRVQEIADELLDAAQARGHMDIIEEYAFPLPINVISEMLGVPKSDWEQVRDLSGALATGLGARDPNVMAHMRAFGEYTAQLVAEKRWRPADDLISQLIAMETEGDRLSETELVSMLALLIFAGHETTSNLIGTGALMLLDHPDQLEKLKADLSLVPSAVEELLRFNGPATTTGPRFATEDIELAGQQIKKGDLMIVALLSANHDETQFTDPAELDIARKLNRHVAFGYGIHVCLGAPLARLEGDIAFTTLLKRMPNLRLSIPRDKITWNVTLNSRRLTALTVDF
ncbi:MAG TPA: cytochrome P450 [Ktedonobacterales bacterium]